MAVTASVISLAFILLRRIITVNLFFFYGLQRQRKISTDSVYEPPNLFLSAVSFHLLHHVCRTAAENKARVPSLLSPTTAVHRHAARKPRGIVQPRRLSHRLR